MGLFDAFKKPTYSSVEPVRSLSDDIAARRGHAMEDEAESRAFNLEIAREAGERQVVLRHLGEALHRCLGLNIVPDGNPVMVEGLWFLMEKMPTQNEPFWLLYFCSPCQYCGTLTKAFRLEHVSPYEKPVSGEIDAAKQEQCLQEIAAFLDRIEAARKLHLCPDCRLEAKPD